MNPRAFNRLVAIPVLAAALLAPVHAQQRIIERQMAVLRDRVNLTSEQTDRIREILTESFRTARAAADSLKADRPAVDRAIRRTIERAHTQIKSLLSWEQQRSYEEVMQEWEALFAPRARGIP